MLSCYSEMIVWLTNVELVIHVWMRTSLIENFWKCLTFLLLGELVDL